MAVIAAALLAAAVVGLVLAVVRRRRSAVDVERFEYDPALPSRLRDPSTGRTERGWL